MSIEEMASSVRDRFNFLVKQYKKIEKKRSTGNDQFIVEGEEIKKQLALFFKEYGNFIKTRKNSFGTFDYDNYVVHLRRNSFQEKVYRDNPSINYQSNIRSSTLNLSQSSNGYSFEEQKDDKYYGELYKEGYYQDISRPKVMESPFIGTYQKPPTHTRTVLE